MKEKVKNYNRLNVEIKHLDYLTKQKIIPYADYCTYTLHTGLYSKTAYKVIRFIVYLEMSSAFTLNDGFFVRKAASPNKRTAKNERLYVPRESSFYMSDFLWSVEKHYVFDNELNNHMYELANSMKIALSDKHNGAIAYNRAWITYNVVENLVDIDAMTGEIVIKVSYREDYLKSGAIRYPDYFKKFHGFSERVIKKYLNWTAEKFNEIVDGDELRNRVTADGVAMPIYELQNIGFAGVEPTDIIKIVEAQLLNNQCDLRKLKAKVGEDVFNKVIGVPFNPIAETCYKNLFEEYRDYLKNMYDAYVHNDHYVFKLGKHWFQTMFEKHNALLTVMEN